MNNDLNSPELFDKGLDIARQQLQAINKLSKSVLAGMYALFPRRNLVVILLTLRVRADAYDDGYDPAQTACNYPSAAELPP